MLPSGAGAQGVVTLFSPPTAESAFASGVLQSVDEAGVVREARLLLNAASLRQAIAASALPGGRRTQGAAAPVAQIQLVLFPDVRANFRRRDLQAAYGGGAIWSGESASGDATLVAHHGQVTGHVTIGGRIFHIEPIAGRLHRVREIDAGMLPADAPHAVAPDLTHGRAAAPPIAEGPLPVTRVDLLVGYTARANNAPGDILADINLAVTLTNRAYLNSGVPIRLNLRGTMLVAGYDEARVAYTTTLYHLTNVSGGGSTAAGRALFAPLRARRDLIGADLVALIREGGEYCGQAWVVESPSPAYSGYGYSQTSRGCIAGYTLAHELGHNMGLLHDRYVEPTAPSSKYNFGFVHVAKRVRDIMSYPNRCTVARVFCAVKNMFSNPRRRIAGVPFGVFSGRYGAADAARRLVETRLAIASYRSTVLP
jgi:hypothetical protein